MKRMRVGVLAMLLVGSAALAQTEGEGAENTDSPRGELTARVLSVSSDSLYLEGESGAAVPIRVTHATQLAGQRLKKDERIGSRLRDIFPSGQEVRARFEVLRHEDGKVENVATSVDTRQ